MSTVYDNEMFEFLTSNKVRFESACNIYVNFPKIKEKILKDFWNEVKNNLDKKIKKSDWKSKLIEGEYLAIYLPLWYENGKDNECCFQAFFANLLGASWGLTLCFEINKEEDEWKKPSDIEKIKSMLPNMKQLPKKTDGWNVRWESTDYDFRKSESLFNALFDRNDVADKLAQKLLDFGERIKDDVNEMCKMVKKI